MHSIPERQGAPRPALLPHTVAKALLIGIVALAASCNPTPTPPVVDVSDAGVSTITRTITQTPPTTTIVIDNDGDAALVGKKKVRLNVTARQDITLLSVVLTHWLAGHNNGSRTIDQTMNQNMSPGTSKLVTNEIPESESLAICEGRYYMWTVAYRRADGQGGLYVGQAKLIMPTKRVLPNGTIEQALCAAPPGPGV